jgi:type IV fimbrial biogenesis protein FimT
LLCDWVHKFEFKTTLRYQLGLAENHCYFVVGGNYLRIIVHVKESDKHSGRTLPELMTTVCMAGILSAIALPGFMNLLADNRMSTVANDLVAVLAYARSEAIKRGVQVTVRHKGTTLGVWEDGWNLFADNNGDGVMNVSDELLRSYDAPGKDYTLRTGANYAKWLAYTSTGAIRSGSGFINDTFRLCDYTRQIKRARAIIIKMGRVRTERGVVKACP